MGLDFSAILAYGVKDYNRYEMPWIKAGYEYTEAIEDWWDDKNGKGEFISNRPEGQILVDAIEDYKGTYPLPALEVSFGTMDMPEYILALPESVHSVDLRDGIERAYIMNPLEYWNYENYIRFIKEHGIEETPNWYLMTYLH